MLFVKLAFFTLLNFCVNASATSFTCKANHPDGRRVYVDAVWDSTPAIVLGPVLLAVSDPTARRSSPAVAIENAELTVTNHVMTLFSKRTETDSFRVDYFSRTKDGVAAMYLNDVELNEPHCEFKEGF